MKKRKMINSSDGASGAAEPHTSIDSDIANSNTSSDVKPCDGGRGSEEQSNEGTDELKQERQQLKVITRSMADGGSPGRRELWRAVLKDRIKTSVAVNDSCQRGRKNPKQNQYEI
jgi:hypothetical protein